MLMPQDPINIKRQLLKWIYECLPDVSEEDLKAIDEKQSKIDKEYEEYAKKEYIKFGAENGGMSEEEFNNLESVDSNRTYILYNPDTTYIVGESLNNVNTLPANKMLMEEYDEMSSYEMYKIYYIMNDEGNVTGFYYNNKYYTYDETNGPHVVDYDETGRDQFRPPISAYDVIHGRDLDIEQNSEIIDEGSVDMNPDNQGGD
jgi:hypothetical protein